ncbi:MAG: radical SAM protein [Candidatus Auribacterota bacterium]|nr:radical SAM protein [Candidatus Auribacterota bacterium]
MFSIIDNCNNNINKFRKAVQFNQFAIKLLQIRMAEKWAKYITPSKLYKTPALPKDIVIRVTEECFLNCKFCAQGGENARIDRKNLKTGPVEISTFRKIVNETSKWTIKPFIKITGGEPLVMGDPLLDMVQEMRERKFIVKLNTNGMLLENKKIARKIAETNLNYLSISIDGGKEVLNEMRGHPKLFDAIMKGIDNVQGYCRELGKKNLMILFTMMVSSDTMDQIEEVYRIALDKNIDWFNIQFLNYTTPESCEQAREYFSSYFKIKETPWTGFCNPRFNNIDPNLVAKQIDNILAMRRSVPISVMGNLSSSKQISKYYFSLEPIRNNICYIPFTGMHVVPPGKAAFCIDYPFYEYGDLREETLASIWYGKRATDFRKDMINYYKKYKKNYPQCQRCNWRFN